MMMMGDDVLGDDGGCCKKDKRDRCYLATTVEGEGEVEASDKLGADSHEAKKSSAPCGDSIPNGNGCGSVEQQDLDRPISINKKNDEDDAISEKDWKPCDAEAVQWVNRQMVDGSCPEEIIGRLLPDAEIPDGIGSSHLWQLIVQLLTEPPKRKKLQQYNTLEDAVALLKTSSKILVITGAGVSVSCGIPDFRSKDGIYERLHRDFPDLPNPQAMFDIDYFKKNQGPFFDFAREIYPGQFKPSRCHMFIKLLEDEGKLLRNYTQNIDTLEQVAGISRVVQCHGSFATATCCACKHNVDCGVIREDVLQKRVPRCPLCPEGTDMAVMKPDIVFFGESLPEHFHQQIMEDKSEADLLIVIGSSMKVRPVALIPNSTDAAIPQIVIDRRFLDHMTFDIELLGNCEDVVEEICFRLGPPWDQLCGTDKAKASTQITEDELHFPDEDPCRPINDLAEPEPKKPKLSDNEETEQNTTTVQSETNNESAPEQSTDQNIDALRAMYSPRFLNLASLIPEDCFLFLPPSKSAFPSAEVLKCLSEDSQSDSSDNASEEGNEVEIERAGGGAEETTRSDSSNSEYRVDSPQRTHSIEEHVISFDHDQDFPSPSTCTSNL